jgi:hypothetical protein
MRRSHGLCRAAILILCFFMLPFCSAESQAGHPPEDVLSKHLGFSRYTDPGEYAYLYKELPESLDRLCALVKKQLIHPFDLGKFAGQIPKGRTSEDQKFVTVAEMLEELLKRDEQGLVASRKPEDRLVVACVHHSMLLASMLRHRGIPLRIRAGFAKYIGGRTDNGFLWTRTGIRSTSRALNLSSLMKPGLS